MNVVVLFFVGIPLVAGVVLRFAAFNESHFKTTLYASLAVFACVGVGFAFKFQHRPPAAFSSNFQIIVAVSVAVIVLVFLLWVFRDVKNEKEDEGAFMGGMILLAPLILGLITYAVLRDVSSQKYGAIALGAAVVISFLVVGALNAILGPISAGFTLSAVMYSTSMGDGFHHTFIWKEFFEFFEISGTFIKILVIAVTSLLSAYDTAAEMLE